MNEPNEQSRSNDDAFDRLPHLNPCHALEFSGNPDVEAHMKALRELYPHLNPPQADSQT